MEGQSDLMVEVVTKEKVKGESSILIADLVKSQVLKSV